jgi:alpha-tubulin suppressor-like RCC1 family protein
VDYFTKRNKKVTEVALGEYHTAALTEDGSVYTWGYGGKVGFFNWMYTQEVGALGHGDKKPYFMPKKVDFFEKNNIKIKKITAGLYHTIAVSENDEVYSWGRGLYGVLGNGSNAFSLVPELNDELKELKDEDPEGKVIQKIESADEYTAALMKDGSFFVWGKNDRGQLGTGAGIGIDMVESENIPTTVSPVDKAGEPHPV